MPKEKNTMKQVSNAAYLKARTFIGLKEIPGPVDEEQIVKDFATVGHSWVKDDETAWCAAFVGARLEEAGIASTKKLNARSYLDWGTPIDIVDAQEGDIVVFWRGSKNSWKGHVGFFVRTEGNNIIVLGGNQSNMVRESPYSLNRLLGVRRNV
jgi:uncharacterized protein (TIGR02594 family)